MRGSLRIGVWAFVCLCASSVTACKLGQSKKEEADRQKSEDAVGIARAKTTLQTVASLEATVKSLPASKKGSLKTSPLKGSTDRFGYRNYDVLFLQDLAHPPSSPTVRILPEGKLGNCQDEVDGHKSNKYVGRTSCDDVTYVIVLRPGTVRKALLSGADSYTPGAVDADAFVFDLSNGKLLGGGHVSAKTPPSATINPSTAESDLETMLGDAVDKALIDELEVATK